MDPDVEQAPIKEGNIKKWTNVVTRFQKRYFTLTNELLTYYKEGIAGEKGQISLKLAKIDPKGMTDRTVLINTGMTELYLQFKTPEEKNEWCKAIIECQQRL